MRYKLIVHDEDGTFAYESDDADFLIKQLESLKSDEIEEKVKEIKHENSNMRLTPYERCRNAVYATGNRWAIENFNATH